MEWISGEEKTWRSRSGYAIHLIVRRKQKTEIKIFFSSRFCNFIFYKVIVLLYRKNKISVCSECVIICTLSWLAKTHVH